MTAATVGAARRVLAPMLLVLFGMRGQPAARAQTPSEPPAQRSVPALEELAGSWQKASSLLALPALNSSQGSAEAAHDVLSVGTASFPPVTMTGETGSVLVDGKEPKLEQVRWYPYQVLRTATAKNLKIETSVRMPYEERGILFHLVLTNQGDSPEAVELKINLQANTSRHDRWGWSVPRDKDPNRFSAVATDAGQSLLLRDTRGELGNCYTFERRPDGLSAQGSSGLALWRPTLRPGETFTVNYVLALGEKGPDVHALAGKWAAHFDDTFAQVAGDWQKRFDAMFVPGNPYFSGHLPALATADEKLRRMYYMSIVSLLSVERTCFPTLPRVYVSNTPQSNCTMMYFWDTREWATTLALLDPAMLKQYLRGWLAKGIYNGYAEEYLTGTLKGPWYSANDLSVFILLDAYLNVTGDRAFLAEPIGDRTVLEHLDAISTHWKSLVRPGRTLADYGKASNLLECVPTYINEVASFNAANVWMMRHVAAVEESIGNKGRAAELRAEADHLLPAVLALYEPGQGVWDSLHRDGTKVQIRHVFDFATIGLTIKDDLSPKMRGEMTGFVERELLVDHWMRAQSLSDVAAAYSNRPDHGPMGAYCAWPAETIAVMCEFGEFDLALDFLHRCVDVTAEGPFSQSRSLLSRAHDSPVRIAPGPQTYNASNGGSFAETIIREFFGYQPDWRGQTLVPDPRPRGFRGQLLGVQKDGRSYNLISDDRGIRVTPVP